MSIEQSVKTASVRRAKKRNRYFDFNLLLIVIFLVAYGSIMVYSASVSKSGNAYLFSQIKNVVIGFAGLFVFSKIPYRLWAPISPYLYAFGFVLMALVWSPLGIESHGARRWIKTPFGQMQPAEYVKCAVILFIPYLICKIGKRSSKLKSMAIYTVFGALASLGVFRITDNLSSAIIVMGITVVLLYVVDPKIKLWLLAGLALILILIFAKPVLSKVLTAAGGFRMQRVLTWLSPESDASDSGFQTLQGLYAIGSGGFFGKGLGNSSQKIRLPEAQNDMIFSIVCEELGIFGMIILLVMFGYLLYRILFIAQNAPDWYGSLVTTGVFGQIAIQVILNLAVVTNVIPNTGISLPFISYGGTSLLFLMAEIGIVLNVSSGIKFEMDE